MRSGLVGGTALLVMALASGGCTSDESLRDVAVKPDQDISTRVGACSMLLGPGGHLVDDALAAGKDVAESNESVASVDRATEVQNAIFDIVANGPAKIQDPAGQLVDYLDDPVAYATATGVDPLVTNAVTDLRKICAG